MIRINKKDYVLTYTEKNQKILFSHKNSDGIENIALFEKGWYPLARNRSLVADNSHGLKTRVRDITIFLNEEELSSLAELMRLLFNALNK